MLTSISLNNKNVTSNSVTGENIKNLSDLTFVIPQVFNFSVVEVLPDWEARPDLVAISKYGDDMFTELICRVNGISNPFELNAGDRLVCPDLSEIYKFFIKDNIDYEGRANASNNVKQTYDKDRKPSDVTVGDSRYKVDKDRKIVIY